MPSARSDFGFSDGQRWTNITSGSATGGRTVDENNETSASNLFRRLLESSSKDSILRDDLLNRVELGISKIENRGIYKQILEDNLQHIESPRHTIKAYYLLSVVLILEENDEQFDATLTKLDEYLQAHKSVQIEDTIDTSLFDEEVFAVQDQDKRTQFETLKVKIKAR